MKRSWIMSSMLIFTLNYLSAMDDLEKKICIEKIDSKQDYYPEYNKFVDPDGNVISHYNGHIYFKSNGTKPKNITFSPDGKKIVYCIEDAAAKDVSFIVHSLEDEKSICTGVMQKTEQHYQPYAAFVDNDTIYASTFAGYPLHVNGSFEYTFLNCKSNKWITTESTAKLRAFGSIPGRSLLLACDDNSPHQIYFVNQKENLIQKTGIISSKTPRVQAANDGKIIAIGDSNKIKTYIEEKYTNYRRLGTWNFKEGVSAFAFDDKNRLVALVEIGDMWICDQELKASLILLNLLKIAPEKLVKDILPLNSDTKLLYGNKEWVIKNQTNQFLVKGDFNKEIDSLEKKCRKQIEKRNQISSARK